MKSVVIAVSAIFVLHSASLAATAGTASKSTRGTRVPSSAVAARANASDPRDSARTASNPSNDSDDSLAPSWQPPWNPEKPVARRRAWENVVLLPQRLLSLPLSAVGIGMDRGLLLVEDIGLPQKIGSVTRSFPDRTGLRVAYASLGERTGMGLRGEAHATFKMLGTRSTVSVAHSATLRTYHDTQLGFSVAPLTIQYDYQWRPMERFYGIGMDAPGADRTDYAVQTQQLNASLGYSWNRDETLGRPRSQIGAWIGPRTIVMRSGREPDVASIESTFPGVSPTLNSVTEQLNYGARFSSDWRMGAPHWFEGWRVLVESQRFERTAGALHLSPGAAPGARFHRNLVEMETGTSFGVDPHTLRFLGRIVDTGIEAGADRMQIADLVRLGDRSGLAAYASGRYHDLDLAFGRMMYLFPLERRFEFEVHVESGAVFSDLWQSAQLSKFQQGIGCSLRGRSALRPMGAIGVDVGREAVRVNWTLGNPDR